MSVSFKIDGAAQMDKILQELGSEVATKLGRSAIRAAATLVRDEAKRLAPVDTGALRDGITVVSGKQALVRTEASSTENAAIVTVRGSAAWRAHFTEFGTPRQAAQPFLRPAMDQKRKEVLDKLAKSLGSGINREVKKLNRQGR